MKTKIVKRISNKGYPINNKCYPCAHKRANKAEKEKYGKRKFKTLNNVINKTLPKEELAGKHTQSGIIQLSNKIPSKYRNQIKFHELIEMNEMRGC